MNAIDVLAYPCAVLWLAVAVVYVLTDGRRVVCGVWRAAVRAKGEE